MWYLVTWRVFFLNTTLPNQLIWYIIPCDYVFCSNNICYKCTLRYLDTEGISCIEPAYTTGRNTSAVYLMSSTGAYQLWWMERPPASFMNTHRQIVLSAFYTFVTQLQWALYQNDNTESKCAACKLLNFRFWSFHIKYLIQ